MICSTFTGEHPYRSVISVKLLCNFVEITLWHGRSPVNLMDIFRTPFPKNTSGGLLLDKISYIIRMMNETKNRWTKNISPDWKLELFYTNPSLGPSSGDHLILEAKSGEDPSPTKYTQLHTPVQPMYTKLFKLNNIKDIEILLLRVKFQSSMVSRSRCIIDHTLETTGGFESRISYIEWRYLTN